MCMVSWEYIDSKEWKGQRWEEGPRFIGEKSFVF